LPLLLASLRDDCRRASVYEWAVVAIMVDVVCANDAGRGMMGVLFHTHTQQGHPQWARASITT